MTRRIRIGGADATFSDPAEYSINNPIHLGIFGRNGTGKTTIAGSSGLRTIVVDCGDAGAVTLRKAKNVKIVRVKTILGFLDLMEKISRMADQLDLLVLDTLSGLQSIGIKEVKGKRQFDMNKYKWGGASSRLIECISEVRNFSKDVIYLMQEKGKETEDEIDIKPALIPTVEGYLSSNVDWIGRLTVDGEANRFLDFRIRDGLAVKDRAGIFPKLVKLPNTSPSGINPSYLGIRKRITTQLQGASNGSEGE